MKIVREIVSTVLIGGASLALSNSGLASEAKISCTADGRPTTMVEIADELVVYGKRLTMEIDRAALRIDLARNRQAVSASIERALTRPEDTVSVATTGNASRN